jgi:hypothetical protein
MRQRYGRKDVKLMLNGANELESKALELMALNIAFESARPGPFKGELLKLAEETREKAASCAEPRTSGSV